MKLSTGKIAFPIEFDNGDKQNIYFNPSDADLWNRFKSVPDKIQKDLESIEDFEMNPDGTPKDEAFLDAFNKMRDIIYTHIDWAFGSAVSEVIFKYCNPFAIVEGQFYIWYFFDALAPEIKKEIEKSQKSAAKRMSKHIDKYKK